MLSDPLPPINWWTNGVLILDGSSEYVAHVKTKTKKGQLRDDAVGVNKCLKEIKIPNSFNISASYSKLPSCIQNTLCTWEVKMKKIKLSLHDAVNINKCLEQIK